MENTRIFHTACKRPLHACYCHDWHIGGASLLRRSCISTMSTRRETAKLEGSFSTELSGTFSLHCGHCIVLLLLTAFACCHSICRHLAQNVWRHGSILGSLKMVRQIGQVTSLRTSFQPSSILYYFSRAYFTIHAHALHAKFPNMPQDNK